MRTEHQHEARPDGADPSLASVEALVRAFEDCSLPRERWDHAAHLLVGLWYVLQHGPERALVLISEGIERYNRAAGRTEAERSGFSARTTCTWVVRIAHFARANAGGPPTRALYRRILSAPLCLCIGDDTPAWSGACPADRV